MTKAYLSAQFILHLQSPHITVMTFSTISTQKPAISRLMLCGDFNARTGSESDSTDIHGEKITHFALTTKRRVNPDPVINKNDKKLVQVCRSLGLYCNARIRGDPSSRFTYCSALGSSVVDYAITDMDPSCICAFTVRPQLPLSDLCRTQQPNNRNVNLCYKWTRNSVSEFSSIKSSADVTNLINKFLITEFQPNQTNGNLAVKQTNGIYHVPATKANPCKMKKNRKQ